MDETQKNKEKINPAGDQAVGTAVSEPPGDGENTQDLENALDGITRSVKDVADLLRQPAPAKTPSVNTAEAEADLQAPSTGPIDESLSSDAISKMIEEVEAAAVSEPLPNPSPSPTADAGLVAEPEPAATTEVLPKRAACPRSDDIPTADRTADVPSGDFSHLLAAYHDPGGRIAEQFRSLRTSLLARFPEDRFCLMVTSAAPREGKTVSCLNLGFVLAEQVDHRTVVVDLDLRKGAMASLLNARPSPGVAEFLLGTAGLSDILHTTVCPNLFYIPAGDVRDRFSGELLGRSGLKKLVEQLRRDFDYVLIDTPAANRFSDAGVAGLATGQALLIVRARKTARDAVEQAIQSLRKAKVDVVGILMTHCRNHALN